MLRRFFAEKKSFSLGKINLNQEQTAHLRNVLRLREGEKISVFDGEGSEFLCEIESIGKKETILSVLEQIQPKAPESKLDLTLAIGLPKGEKFELIIQKTTELGVSKIIPLITKRCDVKLAGEAKRFERWQKISLESAKQCGRAKLPKIEQPVSFESFIKTEQGLKLFFTERDGKKMSEVLPKSVEKITGIVGSEGGWDDAEIESAKENCSLVTLGGRILRAETAGIVTVALIQNFFGDLN